MQNVFIAGVDHGIGQALAHAYLDREYTVYAIGAQEDKTLLSRPDYYFTPVDMHSPEIVHSDVESFAQRHTFERVILASETMGSICDMSDLPLHEFQEAVNVNVLSVKQILDALLRHATVQQAILIGADATRLRHRGWGSYIATKEMMSDLLPFYAEEYPDTHFSTIVPGLTATPELSHIFKTANTRRFPSVMRIRNGLIKSPGQTAEELLVGFDRVQNYRSGEQHHLDKLLKQ